MMREAIKAATPAITTGPGTALTQQAHKDLHGLR
jgi:hypothetical protein